MTSTSPFPPTKGKHTTSLMDTDNMALQQNMYDSTVQHRNYDCHMQIFLRLLRADTLMIVTCRYAYDCLVLIFLRLSRDDILMIVTCSYSYDCHVQVFIRLSRADNLMSSYYNFCQFQVFILLSRADIPMIVRCR
jgi:hypothetical protein